ncbi:MULTISPECIES: TetR/AcrR family transcriptional regulator [unclassified Streptomyces]|uniref:TetR/AcrR family transcriptional regulator n=1 Tax=unclassified Streptomyces TaxID=2593676 RepID=UPI002DD7A2DB|nr:MULTISPECIES: TetR/AcrR family transcriptional regulator [unclassified Streptomyces]WSA91280.1 TetR/AcrR family transcriptional regulator [Streptomyces sp. NBC_01795]WSB75604.1 TetR/AcrR family transcriptional regulator [Streptomyces sp. NBC_01775]WSS16111.1 TetR/AcrR family transcriptional regulator [Streptomyces sp. NBC_01186]WSS44930.1 TetR/AcrR family transcriptional regulator [Streptomyces sp. NBC_01187]
MSPRGVATPDVRERLFAAAERVVERDGPGALTSRAVTTEAGCAKGLLHAHFAGLDEFVAELCLDRFARTAVKARALSGLAGQGTVARNLDAVVLALFDSGGPAVSGLAMTRPAATLRIREALEGGAPGFTAIQEAVTDYLKVEQRLGRIAETADPHTAALAVVGTAHHLLMTSWPGTTDPRPLMERLVAALVNG